jgi:small G protein signaling modulator 3
MAFVAKYPDLGYTQGLNTIAGYLLLAIPSEEDAFWVLCNIVENYFPADYFARTDAMVSPLADNTLLRQYMKELMPQLNAHLDDLNIQPGHSVPIKWFFTAFSSALTETVLMRMWDIWLCLPNQKQFPFSIALALLAYNADGILACEDSSSFFSYVDSKLNLPEDGEQLTELMKQAYKIGKRIGENVVERRADEVEKTKASMNLENRLRRRKTQSLEVLVDREQPVGWA